MRKAFKMCKFPQYQFRRIPDSVSYESLKFLEVVTRLYEWLLRKKLLLTRKVCERIVRYRRHHRQECKWQFEKGFQYSRYWSVRQCGGSVSWYRSSAYFSFHVISCVQMVFFYCENINPDVSSTFNRNTNRTDNLSTQLIFFWRLTILLFVLITVQQKVSSSSISATL